MDFFNVSFVEPLQAWKHKKNNSSNLNNIQSSSSLKKIEKKTVSVKTSAFSDQKGAKEGGMEQTDAVVLSAAGCCSVRTYL